jgi:hypothetical protein
VASWTDVSAFLGNDFGLDFGYRRCLGFVPSLLFFLFEQRRKHPIQTQFSLIRDAETTAHTILVGGWCRYSRVDSSSSSATTRHQATLDLRLLLLYILRLLWPELRLRLRLRCDTLLESSSESHLALLVVVGRLRLFVVFTASLSRSLAFGHIVNEWCQSLHG